MRESDAGGDGIWPWSADNTIIQYNEVYNCYNNGDGDALDSDYNCYGTIFQYNYSHENPGGFMLLTGGSDGKDPGIGNVNTSIRYNISQNDGYGNDSDDHVFRIPWPITNMRVYNNVIYNGPGSDTYLMLNKESVEDGVFFRNNIFMSEGTYRFGFDAIQDNNYDYNCWIADKYRKEILWYKSGIFVAGKPGGANSIELNSISDAKLVNPGSGGYGLDSLDGYKLQLTSPCIGAGTTMTDNGGIDYWGNALYNSYPDVGAHEKP
jgi:hypothetical protein